MDRARSESSRVPPDSSPVELEIERAVAGGRMLARHGGMAVLVSGAIPGERVRAVVERRSRGVSWARVVAIDRASPDRRDALADPLCGGMTYAHIAYDAQRRLKADVVADTFRRVGKMALPWAVEVEPSPERGYRLRARLHLEGDRAGFFREGTHSLCDAASTGQLRPETIASVRAVLENLGPNRTACAAITVAENVRADARVFHLEPRPGGTLEGATGGALPAGVSGITTESRGRIISLAGEESVADEGPAVLSHGAPWAADIVWRRRAPAFFQSNRYLAGALLRYVLEQVQDTDAADFYAGVGLFAIALGARGQSVVAVEGDRVSGEDLEGNAQRWPNVTVVRASVEEAAARLAAGSIGTAIVDPPRTGLSGAALETIMALRASRVVYVSCDPPTLARDAAKLVASGYALASVRAFDLFPNTPHVETVVIFDRGRT